MRTRIVLVAVLCVSFPSFGAIASAQPSGSFPGYPSTVGGSVGDFDASGQTGQLDLDLPLLNWGMDAENRPSEWVNDFPVRVIDHFELNRVLLNWGNESGSPRQELPKQGVEEVVIDRTYPTDILPGYVTNDVRISFHGQYTGSQLRLDLRQGDIFQETSFGGGMPLHSVFHDFYPETEFDTFLANGFLSSEGTTLYSIQLGAVNLGGDPTLEFGTSAINAMWHPAGSPPIVDRLDFFVARITLSLDAEGTYSYVAFTNGVPTYVRGLVERGELGFPVPFPEPSAIVLAIPMLAVAVLCVVLNAPKSRF